ncbi:MAG TPA: PQQ-binding-like beta-propeller repeat protein [Gemmatimonadaceae bacterium]|nr:PQQ-binding-like beta-propeller repeat protein [Gemmatimonadaceae bacterium]
MACLGILSFATEGSAQRIDWPSYGSDPASTKFSTANSITPENVSQLKVVWQWETGETPNAAKKVRPGNLQVTPLVVHDTMYLSTSYNRVVALDANTGRLIWEYDPRAYDYGQPPNGTGFVHRGVALWSDGTSRRVFMNSRWRLIALDAATGRLIRSFGDTGVVDLVAGLSRATNKLHYTQTSPPVVWGNLVIVGNGVADRLVYPGDPPGDVQAFDVVTGKRVWRWSGIPLSPTDEGAKTWENDSWKTTGHTNVWAPFSVDVERGLLYLPVSTASNDGYGGARLGDNLFAESIVCLDARTGKKVWHFQTVHHGLWDYDLPAAPVLGTVKMDGVPRDIVAVPTKMGFLFVFDRVTGKPIWPIEERPVPSSDVPGERASPTQPFPTKPKPFAPQGFTSDDLVDLSRELQTLARAAVKSYRMGPLYTPPSVQGTIVSPGVIGGAGWGGGAFDPASGTFYIKATNQPALLRIRTIGQRTDTVNASFTLDLAASGGLGVRAPEDTTRLLPVNKPPYGTLTAIDLNSGEQAWQVTLGDSPEVRDHPALHGANLPPLGVAGAPGAIVTATGLLFASGGGRVLYALDTRGGSVLWSHDIGQRAYSVPMTYRTSAGRQFVVIASGAATGAKLTAFSLP